MQQKKAVQVLGDAHDFQASGSYISGDYIAHSEGAITTTNDKETSWHILKLYRWVITVLRLSLIIILRTVSWLNHLGGDEVDVKGVESSHKHHLGSRIHRMGH